ncbi:hypothetical protein PIB30_031986 [Stylosanthes scabra]|uniref:Zinc knuckle CX2CX4HX4C domain-containing protein n=1 Tax=Stylosanthes scabra TaxID=79078 RepID=A0ABU6QCA5_9FABA|nr:hypothetical protein [Stylosanthes scabra]
MDVGYGYFLVKFDNPADKEKRKIRKDGHVYDVEYENLHLLCEKCHCFGHLRTKCNGKPVLNDKDDQVLVPSSFSSLVNLEETHQFEFGKPSNVSAPNSGKEEDFTEVLNDGVHVTAGMHETDEGWQTVSKNKGIGRAGSTKNRRPNLTMGQKSQHAKEDFWVKKANKPGLSLHP